MFERSQVVGGNGTHNCPYCGYSSPHEHFIDRKGYVRGLRGEVLGRRTDTDSNQSVRTTAPSTSDTKAEQP